MRRAWLPVGAAVAALLVTTSAQGTLEGGPAAKPKPKPRAKPRAAVFDAKAANRLTITTAAYRLTLTKENGSLVELVDRKTGVKLFHGQGGCGWTIGLAGGESFGGCAFNPRDADRFSYRWSPATSTLTLRYASAREQGRASATLTLAARKEYVDLRLDLETHFRGAVASVLFPADLVASTASIRGVYTPTFLPGIRLLPGFFTYPHRNVERYPSRWAFADFLAADAGRSHVALSAVNPGPAPIAPADLGVTHDAEGLCSGKSFCFTHAYQTWLPEEAKWSSPLVRLRVGGSVQSSILAYRQENGIDRYPSLVDKLGQERLDVLARAPLVKADPWKGLPRFADWGPSLRRLPSPMLLHPVAFQAGGHDEDYPDFLPPDPVWGTGADFNRTLDDARSLGAFVMPYLNVSWWDTQAPTVRSLPAPLTPADIAMQTAAGAAVTEQFGDKDGYVVSPYVPFVRERVQRLMEEWRTEVPAECVFFDQIGARPWRRDFNPAAPSPIAYEDGWLAAFEPYRDRCLMTEDGWDRLADAFVGFHGSALQMQREHRWPDARWGEGNWEPYPLALWLLHDKVLLYQHDLYEGTMTDDPEVLLFNVAFGMVLSYNWDGEARTLDSPWLEIVGEVQRALGPHIAGRPLTSYREVAPRVTEATFGDATVIANWQQAAPFEIDGYRIAPLGFLARAGDGGLLAGAFGDRWTDVTVGPGG